MLGYRNHSPRKSGNPVVNTYVRKNYDYLEFPKTLRTSKARDCFKQRKYQQDKAGQAVQALLNMTPHVDQQTRKHRISLSFKGFFRFSYVFKCVPWYVSASKGLYELLDAFAKLILVCLQCSRKILVNQYTNVKESTVHKLIRCRGIWLQPWLWYVYVYTYVYIRAFLCIRM